jgi:ribosome-associated protein
MALAALPVSTPRLADAKERALHCARIAEDNKARDIRVLDLRGITPLYDYFVVATGTGRRQIHAIVEEVDDAMRSDGDTRRHIEGYASGKWIVQDYGDVVVHVFDSTSRDYYGLDDLWANAPRLDWEHSY